MRTTEGGRCLRRVPGFWFGTGPHTPAQRVWPTRAPLRSQDGDRDLSSVGNPCAAGWPGKRRTDHPGHRPGHAPIARPAARGGEEKAWEHVSGLET